MSFNWRSLNCISLFSIPGMDFASLKMRVNSVSSFLVSVHPLYSGLHRLWLHFLAAFASISLSLCSSLLIRVQGALNNCKASRQLASPGWCLHVLFSPLLLPGKPSLYECTLDERLPSARWWPVTGNRIQLNKLNKQIWDSSYLTLFFSRPRALVNFISSRMDM